MRPRLGKLLPLALAALLAGCAGTGAHSTASPSAPPRRPPYPTLAVPPNVPPRTVRVPILTYHRVHEYATELTKSVPDLTVEPQRFAAEMSALRAAGYRSISDRQLFDALYRGAPLPPRPVLITVDDGYTDDVAQILPVLEREHMVATFYVITGRFHEPGFLTEADVRKLDAAGMDVGDHTAHHLPLPELGPATLESEIAGSRAALERVVGHPVYFFAYPFGELDAGVVSAVRRAGFLVAMTTRSGALESTAAPLTMPRLHVGRFATPASVLALAAGGSGAGSGGE